MSVMKTAFVIAVLAACCYSAPVSAAHQPAAVHRPFTYGDLKKLVLSNVPWANGHSKKKKVCDTLVCQDVQQMCKNGGKCLVTAECSFRCDCPNGFTGFFCEVKVADLGITTSFEVHANDVVKTKTTQAAKTTKTTTVSSLHATSTRDTNTQTAKSTTAHVMTTSHVTTTGSPITSKLTKALLSGTTVQPSNVSTVRNSS